VSDSRQAVAAERLRRQLVSEPGLRLVSAQDRPDVDQLVGQVALGDPQAFEALYDELSSTVFGLARRVVRDLEVWRKAARFDRSLGKAKTWVLTIAHRRAVDAVRRSESQRRQDNQVTPEEVSHDEPVDAVITAEDHFAVRTCLDTLTELQLESVRLAYFNGYTYTEVAALLDKPLPTIKTRMRDGLIRLRDCLEGNR
jgi:RNA polymerase sigma-70 factor (ECF subfamily)